jgi:TolB protein
MNITGTSRPRGGGRRAAVTAALTIGLIAGGSTASLAAGGAPAGHGTAALNGAALGAGQVAGRAAVPWRRVGPGWVLAEYWNGRFAEQGKPKAAPATLYLVDPAGGRYRLYQWASTKTPPDLQDWSGDKTRALVATSAGGLEQITLATGKVSRFSLAGQASASGYTRPDGLNILGWTLAGSSYRLARYTLTGARAKVLFTGPGAAAAVYASNGDSLAAGANSGLVLVSNAGGKIRSLHASGTGCTPARWWSTGTILASCLGPNSRSRLWLVPASGAKAKALTPARGPHSPDLGDLDAWKLPGGLYLEAAGPCGTLQVFRQAASGSITLVKIPHTSGNNHILAADGAQLLIGSPVGCSPGETVLWFNPATRHEHVLFKSGVLGAVPYGRPSADF